MNFSLDDTITAIATPPGEGGIGIVRLSGPDALSILQHIFTTRPKSISSRPVQNLKSLIPARLTHGYIVEPDSGTIVDEVMAVYLPAPHTYTREDVAEIHGHGGPVPLRRILELTLRHGARLAGPGEFTFRAFMHGRLDLAQAEAVADIVRAKTEAGLRVAIDQLGGRLSEPVRRARRVLIDILAYLEASLDFTADEVPPQPLTPRLQAVTGTIQQLLAEADRGIILRQGIRVAIVGRPNVGKSSLLNALLRTDRAIVTPIPGTTRDTLEEALNLGGVVFILVDTAGITEGRDAVEKLGIERSRAALARADLVLLVLDRSQPLTPADWEIAALAGNRPLLVVLNKSDLPQQLNGARPAPAAPGVQVSALTGLGLDELEKALLNLALGNSSMISDVPLVTQPRHKAALQRALEHLQAAIQAEAARLTPDLIAIEITAAANALGEITGETVGEEVLEAIFAQFCVGK